MPILTRESCCTIEVGSFKKFVKRDCSIVMMLVDIMPAIVELEKDCWDAEKFISTVMGGDLSEARHFKEECLELAKQRKEFI